MTTAIFATAAALFCLGPAPATTAVVGHDAGRPLESAERAGAGAIATAPGSSTAPSSSMSSDDLAILAEIHKSNLAEIGHGKMAQESAAAAKVKSYGRTLEHDHAAGDRKLLGLIKRKNVDKSDFENRVNALATTATEQEQLEKLHSAKGADFDKTFVSCMVTDHERDIQKVNVAIDKTTDIDVKRFLQALLPTLEKHKREAEALASSSS